jgi:patatin-related protein
MKTKTSGMEVRKEVRFAVVMYGGVSLAIYINGVAQELLKMVRATAADARGEDPLLSDEELRGTERVYRQLGQILGREGEEAQKPVDPDTPTPIRTRFTVDILSGTSAGGINAVYLAKALANGQTIDQLKRLWVEEGDILKLINDAKSVEQLDGLKAQKPPKSLLNSQRMYRRLLEALDGMEEHNPSTKGSRSPYLGELDLFVTATDFHGLPLQLRLSDDVVEERRHRNVFHFRYAHVHSEEASNDFHAGNDPFLAYAARCTSAFPFAFDPMKLSDIDSVLETMTAHRHLEDLGLDRDRWQRFFPDYRQPAGDRARSPETYDFTGRPFVDGGYLDNKPFGHAIDALAIRNSGVPVDRKLIYIDPSPEMSAQWSQADDPINPVENAAAAFSLARYETIREDLQRVRARNRLIERVESIISGRESDVQNRAGSEPISREDFGKRDLGIMIEAEGVAYGGYHRLKVGALTDEIAGLITRVAGFDLQSDEFRAIRYFVREWREEYYTAYRDGHQGTPAGTKQGSVEMKTQNEFLVQYDLAYRIRRLDFVLNRIDRLYGLDQEATRILEDLRVRPIPKEDTEKQEFRAELRRLHTKLDEVLAGLRKTRAELELPGSINPLHKTVAKVVRDTGLTAQTLREVLEEPTEEQRSRKAKELLLGSTAGVVAFHELATKLERRIRDATVPAAEACQRILDGPETGDGEAPFADAAVEAVRHYYESYDHYDMITYPILYSTEVGEEIDAVDVLRVSPEDATSLIDERDPNERRRKLAGTSLRNFGVFLDRGWRRNDILWGRLDGAERIVSALLPGDEQREKREELIRKAQLAILEEEVLTEDRDQVLQLIANTLAATDSTGGNEAALRRLVEEAGNSSINSVLEEVLRSRLTREELLEFFRNSYEVNRKAVPKTTLRGLSRSTRVVGEMLESISDGYRGVGRRPAAWLARFGRLFWGFVEVAVPRSLLAEIFRYWLRLLYFFEVLLIAAGTVFVKPQVQLLGLVTFGVTAAIHGVILLLRDYMLGRRAWLRILVTVFVIALLILAVVGADALFDLRTRLFGPLLDG